jgi:hypothetical protein
MAVQGDAANVPLVHDPAELLLESCRQIRLELRAQNLTNQVRSFSGEGAKRYRDWLKDILRVGRALEAGEDRMRALALQTLTGPAADYLTRYLNDHPGATWDAIRAALALRFSDAADTQHALNRLRHSKQQKGETIQNFAERILTYADEAFPGENINNPLIQTQLRDAFIDGVTDENVARHLIKNLPPTLDHAVTRATTEMQADRAYRVRRKVDEPMDIDHVNRSGSGILEGKLDQVINLLAKTESPGSPSSAPSMEAKLDKLLKSLGPPESIAKHDINSVTQVKESVEQKMDRVLELLTRLTMNQNRPSYRPRPNEGSGPRNTFQWTSDGRPICAYCKIPGHIQTMCKKRLSFEQGTVGMSAKPSLN